MKIEYIQGDLLTSPDPFIAHGCNAQGVMGSGVAKILRDKWPEVFESYHACFVNGGLSLGTISLAYLPDKTICNCITQEFYGRDKYKTYCDYSAIRNCMKHLNTIALDKRVSMPKIGAGLANGRWDIIEVIIEEEFTKSQPVVYIL